MAERTDWLPGRREAKIPMAKDWLEVPGVKATAWQVPAGEVSALGSLFLFPGNKFNARAPAAP
ncbi:MAG: hypothetical protein LBT14_05920 [Treponema sp.]|jgi:hypothetical protein|nr:hypothetical protein [Treponema sp.]